MTPNQATFYTLMLVVMMAVAMVASVYPGDDITGIR